ncbi:uncharacterized protein LOC131624216 [Vicia villosa]|uniref:uncharacterized protein LOC131624216 n=1 Tax=Vicia villosa TaxID=3911 RepID=UPI00273AA2E2|nr:uncharacterized protein LOC131624216 [Vicia villosa]
MEEDFKLVAQPQRRLNSTMKEVVRKEVIKLLEVEIIYPISDSAWIVVNRCPMLVIIVVNCRLKVILRLGLKLSSLNGEMVVNTPAKGSVTTSLVCLRCPLSIFDRDFIFDFVCLSLRGLDVIIGMNWLEYNHVHINCYDKSVRFSIPEEEGVKWLSTRQLRLLMKEEVQVFALMASLSIENQAIID